MNSKGLYWEFHFPNPSKVVRDSITKKKNPWMHKCSVHIFIQCSVLLVSGSEKKCSLCVEEVFKTPHLVYLFKAEFGGQADGEHCICQSQVIGPPSLLRRHFLKPSILGFLWAFCRHGDKMFFINDLRFKSPLVHTPRFSSEEVETHWDCVATCFSKCL